MAPTRADENAPPETKVPYMLTVTSPKGQTERDGYYLVVTDKKANCLPMWKQREKDNYLYGMSNGQWGIATEYEISQGESCLCYIHCPSAHGGRLPHEVKGPWRYWTDSGWVSDNSVTVKICQADPPKLTSVAQAVKVQDDLIKEFSKESFQRNIHEAWNSSQGDSVKQKETRILISLPLQIKVIQKYGFEPSLRGVRMMTREFKFNFDQAPAVSSRNKMFDWLLNPDEQSKRSRPHVPAPVNIDTPEEGDWTVAGFEGFDEHRTITFRLISGQELGTSPVKTTSRLLEVREGLERALEGRPLKLVSHTRVLQDTETLEEAGVCDGDEVTVVLLHFHVIVSSTDGIGRMFDTTTGECRQHFAGHGAEILAASASADGERVATASADGTARIFDAATSESLQCLAGHRGKVNTVVFTSDGQHVLTASDDCTMKLFNVQSGACDKSFSCGGETVRAAVFSPSGDFILAASGDFTAKLFSAKSGKHMRTFRGHGGHINSAVFSPSGDQVLTASDDHTAKVFQRSTGLIDNILLGHSMPVKSAAFSRDGQQVISASDDCTARIFDVATGGVVQVLQVHGACRCARFLPDGRHVIATCADWLVVFNAETSEELRWFAGQIGHLNHIFVEQSLNE